MTENIYQSKIFDAIFADSTPDAQKSAIRENNNLITAGAGAGTGKTWVLSGRYLNILLTQPEILPCDILTLTYTESAASEMKRRIEARINSIFQNLKDFPKNRKREILDGMADTWISTIHSFAVRIIHEAGLSLDIDPAASVIPEYQTQAFWNDIENAVNFANMKALAISYGNKILRDNAEILDNDNLLSAAVAKWGSGNLSRLAQSVAEMHAATGHTWEEMLAQAEDDILFTNSESVIKNILVREWGHMLNFWRAIPDLPAPKKTTSERAANFLAFFRWAKNFEVNYDNLKNFYTRLVVEKSLIGTTGEPFKTLKDYLHGLTLSKWREAQSDNLKNVTAEIDLKPSKFEIDLRKSLLKFCAVSWGMWDNMKRRRGLLTFSDMIIHAKNAIENGSVKRSFNHILVDEFQDTDPLQFQMIKSIAEKSNASLFAVGDPKQSIYRFRHAEPSLFAETVEQAKTHGSKIELDVSFRTRKNLLEHINNLFGSVWRYGLGSSEAMSNLKYEPLKTPANKNSERDNVSVPDFLVILARQNPDDNSKDIGEILANALASKLAEMFNLRLKIWDKDSQKLRAIKFSDIAILMRDRNYYDLLEDVFNQHGIKTIQDHSKGFLNRGEILDVIATLNAAADFNNNVAVAGWLMSPLSGLEENQAVKILQAVDKNNSPAKILQSEMPIIYKRLEFLKLKGELEGASGLLSVFDKDRRWLKNYKSDERLRVLRNLRRAIILTGSFQQSGTASLKACANWLSSAVKKNENIDEASWHSAGENAVLLSTVHASKGLEYPVTVIFEPKEHRHNDFKTGLTASKNLGLAFSQFPDEMQAEDTKILSANRQKLFNEQGESEESMRLFYVAATRAQDSLIFCGFTNSDGEALNKTWTKILFDNGFCDDAIDAEDCGNFKVDIAKNDVIRPNYKHLNIHKPKKFLQQVSATSFALFEFCPYAWRRKYLQGRELEWSALELEYNLNSEFEIEDNKARGGADLGSLAHWILSRWPVDSEYKNMLEYYLNDREVLGNLPLELKAVWRDKNAKNILREYLLNFASSTLGATLISAGNKIKREHNFRIDLDGIILTGAIDAYYKSSQNEYVILDYKTSTLSGAPLDLYTSQLEFYSYALHELTGCEKIFPLIIFLKDANQIHKLKISNTFEQIKTRIKNFAYNAANGLLMPDYNKCQECKWSKGCRANAN